MVYTLNLVFLCYLRHLIRTKWLHSSRTHNLLSMDMMHDCSTFFTQLFLHGTKSKSGFFTSLFSFSFTTRTRLPRVFPAFSISFTAWGGSSSLLCPGGANRAIWRSRKTWFLSNRNCGGREFTTSTLRSPGTVFVFVFFVFFLSLLVCWFVGFLCLFVCLFVCFFVCLFLSFVCFFPDSFVLSSKVFGSHTIPIKGSSMGGWGSHLLGGPWDFLNWFSWTFRSPEKRVKWVYSLEKKKHVSLECPPRRGNNFTFTNTISCWGSMQVFRGVFWKRSKIVLRIGPHLLCWLLTDLGVLVAMCWEAI